MKTLLGSLTLATVLSSLTLRAEETNKLTTAQLRPAAHAEESKNWSFEIAPYLWLASLETEASLPSIGSGISPSVQHFDTRFSGGFMVAGEARYRSVGLMLDFNWLQLDTESLHPGPLYSGVDLRSDYIYTTAALTYTLPLKGKFHMEALAGARLWNIDTDFELKSGLLPGFTSGHSKTWVNPLVGLDLRYDLTRHWRLLTRGTVGGFAADNVQWDLFGGVGYRFTHWCQATLGYRYLDEHYDQDNFTFNAKAHGALVGVGFQF